MIAEPAQAGSEAAAERRARSLRTERAKRVAASYALLGVLFSFIVVFSILENETFFTGSQARTILSTQAVLVILSIATIIPLIIGEFDLSVAANLGLGMVLSTGLMTRSDMDYPMAIAFALVATTTVGLINGFLVANIGVNAFITTLGTSTIITGAVNWYTGGTAFFQDIPEGFLKLGQGELWGIPYPVYYMAFVAVFVWYVLEQTPLGRYLYALGGSKEAARLSGLNVRRLTLFAFVASGFLAGVAGIVAAAKLGSGNPTVGPPYLLPAFAAAFLGATAIHLGKFNVPGTVIAVFTLAVGVTGLELMGVPYYIEPIFQGLTLILAVAVTRYLRREAL